MRKVNTKVIFLASSLSDTMYVLLFIYILITNDFSVSDRSNCGILYLTNYLSTNFNRSMLNSCKFKFE